MGRMRRRSCRIGTDVKPAFFRWQNHQCLCGYLRPTPPSLLPSVFCVSRLSLPPARSGELDTIPPRIPDLF
jgi:hypothetical protein